MKLKSREINIFSMSALDLFASGMGAFILLAVMALPFFPNTGTNAEGLQKMRQKMDEVKQQSEQQQQKVEELEQQAQQQQEKIDQLENENKELQETSSSGEEGLKLPSLDLVIALDLTYSMQEPLAGLQNEIRFLTESLQVLSPEVSIGIIGYTDTEDETWINTRNGGIDAFDLTSLNSEKKLNGLVRFVDGMQLGFGIPVEKSSNKWPESIDSVIKTASRMSWRSDSDLRILAIITDAESLNHDATVKLAKDFASDGVKTISILFQDTPSLRQNLDQQAKRINLRNLTEISKAGNGQLINQKGSISSMILTALVKK